MHGTTMFQWEYVLSVAIKQVIIGYTETAVAGDSVCMH